MPAASRWYRRIGPSLITACVVIGPGSIMTSSKIGANEQYSMLWVAVAASILMLLFISLGAKLGAVAERSPMELVRHKGGRWLAALLGFSAFLISSAFQSGNNLGAVAALESFIDSKTLLAGWIVLLNLATIAFFFGLRRLYKRLEKLMATFVGIMLLSFAINLILLRPDVVAMGRGLIPSWGKSSDPLSVIGLIGTTFVATAAFYQAYLVREKGWRQADLHTIFIDARIGVAVMLILTALLMSTAAAGLYTGQPVHLANPLAVASGLEKTLGMSAKIIFSLGLFSAAYSSFFVNSLIGGFLASDGLGWGGSPNQFVPKLLASAVLTLGAVIAIAVILFDFDRTPAIIVAQALTVVASPLIAGVLLWLTSSRTVMGQQANRLPTILLGLFGLAILGILAAKTALVDIPGMIRP